MTIYETTSVLSFIMISLHLIWHIGKQFKGSNFERKEQ